MSGDIEILIAKNLSENISEDEQKLLDNWLKADDRNSEEFQRHKKLWDHSINLARESSFNVDEAWEEFKLLADSQPARQIRTPKLTTLRIAAAIGLLVTTFIVVKLFIPKTAKTVPLNELAAVPLKKIPVAEAQKPAQVIITTGDSAKEFFLPDGSRVHLYKNSSLAYSAAFGKERNIYLTGEAFFDVVHGEIPFIAFCQDARIRDIGTSFNIRGYEKDKDVEVFVVTGKVELSDNKKSGSEIIISENEWGNFSKERHVISKPANVKKDIKKREKTTFIQKIKKWIKKLKKKKK